MPRFNRITGFFIYPEILYYPEILLLSCNPDSMTKEDIIDVLKTVYDPEVPILDIYSMWLIYDIDIKENIVNITMTLTSPACPMGDMILEMVKNSITEKFPDAEVNINLTFEPAWEPKMIKDEDIREMFLMQ